MLAVIGGVFYTTSFVVLVLGYESGEIIGSPRFSQLSVGLAECVAQAVGWLQCQCGETVTPLPICSIMVLVAGIVLLIVGIAGCCTRWFDEVCSLHCVKSHCGPSVQVSNTHVYPIWPTKVRAGMKGLILLSDAPNGVEFGQ